MPAPRAETTSKLSHPGADIACVLDDLGKFNWKMNHAATCGQVFASFTIIACLKGIGMVNKILPIQKSIVVSFGILYPREYVGTVSDICKNVVLGSWHSSVTPSCYQQ